MKAVKTITEQVYQAIYDDIMTGSLPQGTRLTLKDLQAKLLVSSSPIREALTRLLADGLIDYQPNVGMSVRTYSEKEISDVFDLMSAFDMMALDFAMNKNTRELLVSELQENINQCEDSIDKLSPLEWNSLTDGFHDIIWKYSDNTFLNEAAAKARMHITIFTTKQAAGADYRHVVLNDHREVLQYIIDDNKEAALSTMMKHIKNQTNSTSF